MGNGKSEPDVSFQYLVSDVAELDGTVASHAMAIRGDGVKIICVAIDRDRTHKYEYRSPALSGVFYANRDWNESEQVGHFIVYPASFWQPIPSAIPDHQDLREIWDSVTLAFQHWPTDFFSEQPRTSKINKVEFR